MKETLIYIGTLIFFDKGETFKDFYCPPNYDQQGDPIPCEVVEILSGSGGGGGSGGSGGGSPSNCTASFSWSNCGGPNGNTMHSAAICGNGSGAGWVVTTDCDGVSSSTPLYKIATGEDCDDCNIPPATSTAPNGMFNIVPNVINIKLDNVLLPFQIDLLYDNPAVATDILNFLVANNESVESRGFVLNALTSLLNVSAPSFNQIINNRSVLHGDSTGDKNNNNLGNYDTTSYPTFNMAQQGWPTIPSVIAVSDFVGWRTDFDSNGNPLHCMDFSKEQIAKNGYQISNYLTNQTIQIYTTSGGVNTTKLNDGLSYLTYALDNDIPVIVGIDNHHGSPNPGTDNSTDHFVVIVGMGSDNTGKYFRFYDNASSNVNQGTNVNNKLYYNQLTGVISGKSSCSAYFSTVDYDYRITQIRKSKSI